MPSKAVSRLDSMYKGISCCAGSFLRRLSKSEKISHSLALGLTRRGQSLIFVSFLLQDKRNLGWPASLKKCGILVGSTYTLKNLSLKFLYKAVKALNKTLPDQLTSEWQLTGSDGWEVKKCKKQEEGRKQKMLHIRLKACMDAHVFWCN